MMKKILYSTLLLFSCLSLVAFSPSNKNANYLDLSYDELMNSMAKEVGSFSQSETSSTTSDKTVWKNRHKDWTLTKRDQNAFQSSIREAIDRN